MAVARRSFLVLAGAALAGGSAPAWAAGPPWQSQWSDLIAAAKKEGKLSMLTAVGLGFRKWMESAEQALGIEVDLQQQNSSPLIATKLLTERGANLYDIDMVVMTPTEAIPRLLPVGAFDRIRPMIFRPDASDGKAWRGGYIWAGDGFGFPLSETVIMAAVDANQVHPRRHEERAQLARPEVEGQDHPRRLPLDDDPRADDEHSSCATATTR